ncbi:MAG: hypothetical protein B7X02_01085, partial [Rhodospirillales bacterium 12-54-5]
MVGNQQRKRPFLRLFFTCHLSLITILTPLAANAGLIRDAEIEHTLRAYADPIFDAADITPSSVRILIIDDPSINAFVAG